MPDFLRWSDPDDSRPEIATLWQRDGLTGIACVHGLEVEATSYTEARAQLEAEHEERSLRR